MLEPSIPRWVKGVEYRSMTVLLSDFRKQLERESKGQISQLNVNAAELLSDLCTFLGLSDENRRKVLGQGGARYVDLIETLPITLTIKH
jgi:hypothetical protein